MLALRAVLDAKPDVFNHNVETIPRLYKCVRSQAIFERSYGFLSSFAGRTLSCFPSSKTTNEEWANRQQRKTIPARFSVFVLLMKQSHSSKGPLLLQWILSKCVTHHVSRCHQ
jgi:hypothetical protein